MTDALHALLVWQDRVDELADAATDGLLPGRPHTLFERVEARAASGHTGAQAFFEAARTPPPWLEPARFERGRRIVVELGTELALVLVTGALLEGYASPSLATPLLRTGRLKTDAAHRLYETGHVLHNARAPGALEPGALGWRTVLQVRLLHSTVRRALESSGYVGPDGGRAIHQLDMAHTATAFSHKGPTRLAQLGIQLTHRELDAVQHFFARVHHLHGVDRALLPDSPEETALLADVLDERFVLGFPGGRDLARAALADLAHRPPLFLPETALATLTCRSMNPATAAAWGIEADPQWERLLAAGATVQQGVTAAWRRSHVVRALRARLSVGLYGRTLMGALGASPQERAFGEIAGETDGLGPGLELPTRVRAVAM